ncbi:MAG TPA: hypothetical protein VF087_00245 [Solirubrobacteraceae bacterium]
MKAALVGSALSEPPTPVHAEPSQRLTRIWLTPLNSSHATYGVPPTLAIAGSTAVFVGSTFSEPPTLTHAEPSQRLTRI